MSDKDEPSTDDATLTSYLDGSDGVTDTYRSLEQAQSPAGLDARILAAAGSTASEPAPGRRPGAGLDVSSWQGIVSLAASLVVGVMIGSVFLGDPGQQSALAPVQEKVVAQGQTVVQGQAEVRSEAPAPPAAEAFAIADALTPEPAAQPTAVRQLAASEEVVVTGARVQRVAGSPTATPRVAEDAAYRQSLVLWLQEIARLQEQAADTGDAALQLQLEEERALFLQRYPNVGLDLELDSLQRVGDGN